MVHASFMQRPSSADDSTEKSCYRGTLYKALLSVHDGDMAYDI